MRHTHRVPWRANRARCSRAAWYSLRGAGSLHGMSKRRAATPKEATQVAEAALALAGHDVPEEARDLAAKVGRGEISAEQAVQAIIARYGHTE